MTEGGGLGFRLRGSDGPRRRVVLAQVGHGELVAEVGDFGADALAGLVAAGGVEDVVDQVGDVLHLRFGEAAGGDGG